MNLQINPHFFEEKISVPHASGYLYKECIKTTHYYAVFMQVVCIFAQPMNQHSV